MTHVDVDDIFDPRTELAHMLLRQAPPRALEDFVPVLQSHDGGRAICLHAAGRPCTTPYQDVSTLLA